MFQTTCPVCRGQGRVVAEPCESCRGERYVEKRRKVLVNFPAGIDGGQRLRIPGQGMPGQPGADAGDLYVEVEVEQHPEFERDGYDIGTRRRISFADAALGGEVAVVLPDETKLEVSYPAGTQPGQILTVRGKGLPHLDRKARGDVHVMFEVRVPEKLSRKAKKLIEELREELGD